MRKLETRVALSWAISERTEIQILREWPGYRLSWSFCGGGATIPSETKYDKEWLYPYDIENRAKELGLPLPPKFTNWGEVEIYLKGFEAGQYALRRAINNEAIEPLPNSEKIKKIRRRIEDHLRKSKPGEIMKFAWLAEITTE